MRTAGACSRDVNDMPFQNDTVLEQTLSEYLRFTLAQTSEGNVWERNTRAHEKLRVLYTGTDVNT